MLPLIISMSLPPMISMFIQSMYNIVDSIFVARLSEDALNAVSIIYPLQNLTLSVSVGLGVGLNSYIARNLGAKKTENVSAACRIGFVLTGLHYIILALFICLGMKFFVSHYTTSPLVESYCLQYGFVVILFSFGQFFHITIEKLFQATGRMTIPMILQAVGCVINIVLDPLLIFGIGPFPAMGVTGAAVATVIGQICSCSLGILFFCMGKSGLPVRKTAASPSLSSLSIVRQIYGIGIPSTLIMALPSMLVAGLNGILSSFSSMAVTTFGIYYKLQTFVYMPATGLVQGIRPIIAYNYGAGHNQRVSKSIRISLTIVGCIMAAGTLLFLLIPALILSIFGTSPDMNTMAIPALRLISIGFLPSAVSIVCSGVFEAKGMGLKSLTVTLLRQIILLLPFAWLFSRAFGLMGVWAAFPLAELLAGIVSCLLIYPSLHPHKKQEAGAE